MSLHVTIITPKGLYKTLETSILNVVTLDGQIGIMEKHLPLVSMLKISKMSTVEQGERKEYAIAGGLLYVGDSEVTVIVDAIESKDDIDINRAKQARERAQERLQNKPEGLDV